MNQNIIKLYSDLKIYQINSTTNYYKEYNLKNLNGFLEIILNDANQDVNLVLYSIDNLNNRVIYFNSSLNQTNFYYDRKNSVEFRQNVSFFNYLVEFQNQDLLNDFKNLLNYLNEAFISQDVELKPVEEVDNVHDLCQKLEFSIKNGNSQDSIWLVQKLTLLNADLSIRFNSKLNLIFKLNNKETQEEEDEKRIELNRLDSIVNVFDLKQEVFKLLKIKPENQMIVINDSIKYDNDLIENDCSDIFVFLIETLSNVDVKLKQEEEYNALAAYYSQDITENIEPFDCDICLEKSVKKNKGVVLKECLHVFCKGCLKDLINHSDDPIVKCPFSRDYKCDYSLQEREIKALLDKEEYAKYELKSLTKSEASMSNTVHCKTVDCIGFCVSEDNLNFFDCPVCEKVNCLRCNVIHMGKTCKEYQDDLVIKSINDKNAEKDKLALEALIRNKKAMYCPGCKIILCKQEGCDWLQCAMCKIEICWATRGPRWGPAGRGDTSGVFSILAKNYLKI